MGREARTEYVSGKERAEVRAHLDSQSLQLTGAKKLTLALTDVRKAAVKDSLLAIEAKGAKFTLALGAKEAAAWANKILNPPSLSQKLGLKPDMKVLTAGTPIAEIDEALRPAKPERAATLTAAKAKAANLIVLTLEPATTPKQIETAAKLLTPKTALWLVYKKGTKPNGDDIIGLARKAGLKDTKVARVSVTHAALRFIAA